MKRITGEVFVDGSWNVDVDVEAREPYVLGGEFGSIIIDPWKSPPLIQGKGDIYVQIGEELARTTRISPGESVSLFSTIQGNKDKARLIGTLTYQLRE